MLCSSFRLRAHAFAVLFLLPSLGHAHMDALFEPGFPIKTKAEPIAPANIQRMAMELDTAPCDVLRDLEDEVKRAILIVNTFMQRPGTLSKIIGPDCNFLGPVQEVAAIEDPLLTSSDQPELLYLLEDYDMLIVTNRKRQSIGYGLTADPEKEPLESFIENRDEATRLAANAKGFAETMGTFLDGRPTRAKPVSSAPKVKEKSSSSSKATRPKPTPQKQTQPTTPDTQSEPEIQETTTPVRSDQSGSIPFEPVVVPEAEPPEDNDLAVAPVYEDELPVIEPFGPEIETERKSGGGALALTIFGIIVMIIVAVIVIRTRVSKKDAYLND